VSYILFADRDDAGSALAARVAEHLGEAPDGSARPLVLALPRGGVPVAARVADAVDGDLDVVVARKIGAPGHPEFGVGALAEDGPVVFDRRSLRYLGLTEADLADTVAGERDEVRRRVARYRAGRPAPDPAGRTVVLVDDGLATGVTARAALRWLHRHNPELVILAAPVCSPQARTDMALDADTVLCLHAPQAFRAVGQFYADFRQLTDADVDRVLAARAP